ncbi:sugar phosphate isomerase/epimerase family protein [Streptomyces anulatus]|uniref:sugar phosphate isomerase/epimerase family protein n=1 Tax=Streptomyces anulatus TaxID=1892 RepID=UPI003424C364
MRSQIALATSSFVARELNGSPPGGWRRDDPAHPFLGGWAERAQAVLAWFAPEETYRERLDSLLGEVEAMGFGAVELWSGHLNPAWATDRQLSIARELLDRRGMRVVAFHGYLGQDTASAVRACQIAQALGTGLLSGGGGPLLDDDRATATAVLAEHGVRLAIENHPEHATPQALLAEVGDGADGLIGVNLDTGWWGTHGYDPVKAVAELADHLLHVQVKDVTEPGGHDPCRLGEGCVPVRDCLQALRGHGYAGAYALEHLPAHSTAAGLTATCRADRRDLESWLLP